MVVAGGGRSGTGCRNNTSPARSSGNTGESRARERGKLESAEAVRLLNISTAQQHNSTTAGCVTSVLRTRTLLLLMAEAAPPQHRWAGQAALLRAVRAGDAATLARLLDSDLGLDPDTSFALGGGPRPAVCLAVEEVSSCVRCGPCSGVCRVTWPCWRSCAGGAAASRCGTRPASARCTWPPASAGPGWWPRCSATAPTSRPSPGTRRASPRSTSPRGTNTPTPCGCCWSEARRSTRRCSRSHTPQLRRLLSNTHPAHRAGPGRPV